MTRGFTCTDCSATFGKVEDAEKHEENTDHDTARIPDRHERDVQMSKKLDAQKPRGKRERVMDGQGKPRADY